MKNSAKIVIGNWKMNPQTEKDAEKLYTLVSKGVSKIKGVDIVICAPFIYLPKLRKISKKINLGAEDLYPGDVGAFTGEISASMLSNIGVVYTIVGHSERRAVGETNEMINKKIKGALAADIVPVLCVGETVRDESHGYFSVVKAQVEECLVGISRSSISSVIIAYEPVWALSTTAERKDATPMDSREMVIFIRKILADKFGAEASAVRIIYGGSVNERDVEGFIRDGGVSGVLVGKASLDAKKFLQIITEVESI